MFNLGIVYKNGRIIGHRSLLKLVANPVLRVFGFQIATSIKHGMIGAPCIAQCTKQHFQTAWSYPSDNCIIKKQRMVI